MPLFEADLCSIENYLAIVPCHVYLWFAELSFGIQVFCQPESHFFRIEHSTFFRLFFWIGNKLLFCEKLCGLFTKCFVGSEPWWMEWNFIFCLLSDWWKINKNLVSELLLRTRTIRCVSVQILPICSIDGRHHFFALLTALWLTNKFQWSRTLNIWSNFIRKL